MPRWPRAWRTWRTTPRSAARARPGVRQVDTEGLLVAAFVHRASRAGDPQLHTHVLVPDGSAAPMGSGGRWTPAPCTGSSKRQGIRAHRVAAGEVEAAGFRAGEQLVGVGDEIVTTRNDRRLMTSASGWVRNGDRWTVTQRHRDGSLTVSHLGGHGRVVLPADYVAADVTPRLRPHCPQGPRCHRRSGRARR
jgi:TrwC relaxase